MSPAELSSLQLEEFERGQLEQQLHLEAEAKKVVFDRTQFPFRVNSDSNFGDSHKLFIEGSDMKQQQQDNLSIQQQQSSSPSSHPPPQHHYRNQKKEFPFEGKATMSTGLNAWDQEDETEHAKVGLSNSHLFSHNIDQASESAMIKIATMQALLDKKLGPECTTQRPGPGSKKLTYLEGWKALDLANRVFGFNGWSSQIIKMEIDYMDQNSSGKWSVGGSCVTRITLRDGTFKEDIGYDMISGQPDRGVALQKVKKGSVTDAMKRTLRQFGNVLGNCLYDKEHLNQISKLKREPVPKVDPSILQRTGLPSRVLSDQRHPMGPPPPPSRPQNQQSGSSASANQSRQNNMNCSSTTPANNSHSKTSMNPAQKQQQQQKQQQHTSPSKPKQAASPTKQQSLSEASSSNNNRAKLASPQHPETEAFDDGLDDAAMFSAFDEDAAMAEFDGEGGFELELDETIDPEAMEAALEMEEEEMRAKASAERERVETAEKGGSGIAWSNADDSGIALSPQPLSKALNQGTPAQPDVTPKMESAQKPQAQPQAQQQKLNRSKACFNSSGSAPQSGPTSLSALPASNVSSAPAASAANSSKPNSNSSTNGSSSLGRRSQTTAESGTIAVGSSFSTASQITREGNEARSNGAGAGKASNNSAQGKTGGHSYVHPPKPASPVHGVKRGPEGGVGRERSGGTRANQRIPLEALTTGADGSVKRKKA